MTSAATRVALASVAIVVAACGTGDDDPTAVEPSVAATAEPSVAATVEHTSVVDRDPDVPELPFDDNPDPSACGMPMPWGDDAPAWLTGEWDGELIQPDVLLYDSHLRKSVVGRAPHGAEVTVVLYQQNPTLDYYFVESIDDPTQEGWVPAPFLAFDPVG